MIVSSSLGPFGKTSESIKVELPLEGSHLRKLEILWEKRLEVLRLVDEKRSSVRLPTHNGVFTFGMDTLQHVVKLEWKRGVAGSNHGIIIRRDAFVRTGLVGQVMVIVVCDQE